jgi:hypothetical protein
MHLVTCRACAQKSGYTSYNSVCLSSVVKLRLHTTINQADLRFAECCQLRMSSDDVGSVFFKYILIKAESARLIGVCKRSWTSNNQCRHFQRASLPLNMKEIFTTRNTYALNGIWQYKWSLSYLKEHLKWYINFFYNYSVSCLVFEVNRLILIKSSVHSTILDMHSIYIRHKQGKTRNFYLANHMSLSIWNSIFLSLFSTEINHNILRNFSKTFCPTWRNLKSLPCLWRHQEVC